MLPTMKIESIAVATAALSIFLAVGPSSKFVLFFVESFQFQSQSMVTNMKSNHRRPISITTTTLLHSETPSNKGSEGEIIGEENVVGETYEGSVDWDAEWKKVVENRDQPSQRPGSYKTPAEISVIKATNKVAKNVFDASKEMKMNMPSVPSIRSLQGDWKFWIGMLLIVSFGLSILSVTSSTSANESFYI